MTAGWGVGHDDVGDPGDSGVGPGGGGEGVTHPSPVSEAQNQREEEGLLAGQGR